jgi:hypothetical protein
MVRDYGVISRILWSQILFNLLEHLYNACFASLNSSKIEA